MEEELKVPRINEEGLEERVTCMHPDNISEGEDYRVEMKLRRSAAEEQIPEYETLVRIKEKILEEWREERERLRSEGHVFSGETSFVKMETELKELKQTLKELQDLLAKT